MLPKDPTDPPDPSYVDATEDKTVIMKRPDPETEIPSGVVRGREPWRPTFADMLVLLLWTACAWFGWQYAIQKAHAPVGEEAPDPTGSRD